MDCPENVKEYVHRVGRAARLENAGNSVLVITPSEQNIIEQLKKYKIPIEMIRCYYYLLVLY